jgi:hypothetical protein
MASTSKLSLEPTDDGYVLRRVTVDGEVTAITLSEADVLTLVQSAPSLRQEILSRYTPKGANHAAVAVTEAVQIELAPDSLGEKILLTPIAPSGSRITFAIPTEIAAALAERLSVHLAQMRNAKPTKQ